MVKVIKHGKLFEEHEATCIVCGCVFTYTQQDVQEYDTGNTKPHSRFPHLADDEPIIDAVIKCPECKMKVVIAHDIR